MLAKLNNILYYNTIFRSQDVGKVRNQRLTNNESRLVTAQYKANKDAENDVNPKDWPKNGTHLRI